MHRYQSLSLILSFLSSLLIAMGVILLVPLVVALLNAEWRLGYHTIWAYLIPAVLSFGAGLAGNRIFPGGPLNNVQAILVVGLGWITVSIVGAIPFVFAINSSYLDGVFEAMSGFTTTGITMYTGLDQMPRSILFWRALMQWIGGLGILTFFLAVTFQGGSTHRLFGAESHKIEMSRPVPGLVNTIKILFGIYALFTLLIAGGLLIAGLSFFDSVAHSLTTISTGGFSPYDASIEHYRLSGHPNYIWIDYIIIGGMLAGGTSFLIHFRVLSGDLKALIDNTEIRWWWTLIIGFVIIIFAERLIRLENLGGLGLADFELWRLIEEDLRLVVFQVIGIITTTGFGTRDIAGPFFGTEARELFLIMMFIGGCVGSTGGGFKVLRIAILFKLIKREVYRLWAPSQAISTVVLDGEPLEMNEIQRIGGLFFIWIVFIIIGGGITALFSDFNGYESLSGMFSAIGNIGPAYILVPEMGQLHSIVKITYIVGMLAGRLEILPVLLLFNRRAWLV